MPSKSLTLDTLRQMFAQHRVKRIFVKALAANDNSKNQPYFGGDFGVLNILPTGKPEATVTSGPAGTPIFKAGLDFWWLADDGSVHPAPDAKLILYPQYPEVRFSGYLSGVDEVARPSNVMGTTRDAGRYLVLGTTKSGRIIGRAAAADSSLARELASLRGLREVGVFKEVAVSGQLVGVDSRALLLRELCRISNLGWIDSKRLDSSGNVKAYAAQNGGGYTLEAELGIMPNGRSEPDYLGWEVKQHAVSSFARPNSGIVTLMTPEPTGGIYVDKGVLEFVRRYGYNDTKGRVGRRNFGGIFKAGRLVPRTGLTLNLEGFDIATGKIVDSAGGIILVDKHADIAAKWSFAGLIDHWRRKHSFASFIASESRPGVVRQYRYSSLVALGTGTTFEHLIRAIANSTVYYDPGIKVEGLPDHPVSKRRSQFRIKISELPRLYREFESVSSCQ